MKTLFTLSALLLSSSAFAYTPEMLSKAINHENFRNTFDNQSIKSITDGPSYRCAGCYGLQVKVDSEENTTDTYNVQVMDFGGRLSVTIGKINEGK